MNLFQKTGIFLLMLFASTEVCKSQSNWNYNYTAESGIEITSLLEDEEYLVIGANLKKFDHELNRYVCDSSVVIKWNPSTSDSIFIDFLPEGYENINLLDVQKKTDGGYICFASLNYYLIPAADTQAIYIFGLDETLNLEWELIQPLLGEDEIKPKHSIQIENNNWVTLIDSWNTLSNGTSINHNTMLEITEQGELLKLVSVDTVGWGERIMMNPEGEGYYIFGDLWDGGQSYEHIQLVDNNFNQVLKKYFIPENYCRNLFYDYYNEGGTTFYLTAPRNDFGSKNIGFYKVEINDSAILILEDYTISRSTHDGNILDGGISKNINGGYYIIGILDFLVFPQTWIGFYNEDIELVSDKIFTKADTAVTCSSAISTSDGGLLVYLNYFEPGVQTRYGSCLMKLDSTLQVEWTEPVNFFPPQEEWAISPNPFQKELLLSVKSRYHLPVNSYTAIIHDINGRNLKEIAITNYETAIDLDDLKAGTYLLNVVKNGVSVFQTKIVKR